MCRGSAPFSSCMKRAYARLGFSTSISAKCLYMAPLQTSKAKRIWRPWIGRERVVIKVLSNEISCL